MAISVSAINRRSYIHVVIMLSLMLGVGFLPPFAQVTPLGMKVLGVFLGLVYGWCFIDLLWTSVLGFFALGLTGFMDTTTAVATAFGNQSVIIILICFAFAECVDRIGVTTAIAYWALGRKLFVGKPWIFISGVIIVSLILSIFGAWYAAMFLMWAVVDKVAEINKIPKGNLLTSMLGAMIVYACFTGASAVPFGSGVILYGGFFTNATGIAIPALPLLISGLIYGILSFALMFVISKVVFKVNAGQFMFTEELRREYAAKKMSKVQKAGLICLLFYFFGLLLSFSLKGGIWSELASWGIVGFSIIYMVIFAVWKDEKGKSICNMADCFRNGIVWDTLLLFGVTIPLSAAMESAEVGITATINEVCVALFSGWSLTIMVILIMVVIGLITQLMHNVVIGAIFIPIFAPLVISMGGNPLVFFFMFYFILQCAYATPAGSMMAAMVFGKENLPTKHAYMFGIMFWAVSELVLIVLMPLWNILF